ncbi:lysophospholipid acyltransferase family protein [Stagnihabitans tardus]|uniref:lysophospholipid acyltransferase family protein n=1 Tax=Stagnihabitans tardus TaxID=2699202 RepID=UPI003390607F
MSETWRQRWTLRGQDVFARAVIGLLRALPYGRRVGLGGWILRRIVGPLAGYDRRIAKNLALIWPDLPPTEVKHITQGVCDNLGRTLAELYSPAEFKARAAASPVRGNLEAVLEAQARGQGVILISGHFGNHDIARAMLDGRGHPVAALYRPQSNAEFDRHFSATIRAISEPLFGRERRELAGLVTHLKKGGMLGVLIDQYYHLGEKLDFLGRPAKTSTAMASMALKYDLLLVPVYGIRQPDGVSFELVVEEPIPHSDPVTMTQAVNDSLAAMVRAHPEQWLWAHRRWR